MWLIETMSAEKIINDEKESPTGLNNIESTIKKSSGRVDINILLNRARNPIPIKFELIIFFFQYLFLP